MRLVNLKSSEARHVMLWLSPEGEITSLLLTEAEITSPSVKRLIASGRLSKTLLVKTAGMICRKKSIISESSLDYLLNHGWAYYYEWKGNWVWRAKEMNRRQLTIAKIIDDNESLRSLLSWKFMESHFCGSCFKKINFFTDLCLFCLSLAFYIYKFTLNI